MEAAAKFEFEFEISSQDRAVQHTSEWLSLIAHKFSIMPEHFSYTIAPVSGPYGEKMVCVSGTCYGEDHSTKMVLKLSREMLTWPGGNEDHREPATYGSECPFCHISPCCIEGPIPSEIGLMCNKMQDKGASNHEIREASYRAFRKYCKTKLEWDFTNGQLPDCIMEAIYSEYPIQEPALGRIKTTKVQKRMSEYLGDGNKRKKFS